MSSISKSERIFVFPLGKRKIKETSFILNSCPLCNYRFAEILFERKSMVGDDFYKVVRCQECTLVYQYPPLNEKEIKRIYSCEYFSNTAPLNMYGYRNYAIYKDKLISDWYLTFKDLGILSYLNNGDYEKKVLDIGCAYGFFLDFMRNRGYIPYGVDISPSAVEFARNKLNLEKVFLGKLEDIKFEDEFFDIITLYHILEHVVDPRKLLEEVYRILKKEGLIIIQIPVIDSVVYKIFRNKWRQFRIPEHTFYFSRKTISLLLKEVGFYPFKFRSWGSGLTEGKTFKFIKKIADYIFKKFDIGDVMAIAAKKHPI